MASLGNIGLFGNQEVNTLRNAFELVNNVTQEKTDSKKLSESTISERLDAFEIVGSQLGLSAEQMKAYSDLLRNC